MLHTQLAQRIKDAKTFIELFPFITRLLDIDALKTQLISALDKNSNIQQDKSIRHLFMSLNIFNGIPSDIMHANIISYLPSEDYVTLPLVCKQFRNVMLNHPFIFKEKGYKIDMRNSKHDHHCFFDHPSQSIMMNHDEQTKSDIMSLKTSKSLMDNIKYWSMNSKPPSNVLSKHENTLQKIEIGGYHLFGELSKNDTGSNAFQFEQCRILSIKDYYRILHPVPIIQNKDIFTRVQCLEIFNILSEKSIMRPPAMPPPNPMSFHGPGLISSKPVPIAADYSPEFYGNLNAILLYLSSTLKCFVLSCVNNVMNEVDQLLIIPQNVEWLKLRINCKLDLSKCNKLIGMDLDKPWACYGEYKWPRDYVIPFIYFRDSMSRCRNLSKPYAVDIFSHESNNKKLAPVRFLIVNSEYVRKAFDTEGVRINEILLKLNEKTQDATDKSLLCLELHEDESNDRMESLLTKILKYGFQDAKVRSEKIQKYQSWWAMKSGLWFRDLCM